MSLQAGLDEVGTSAVATDSSLCKTVMVTERVDPVILKAELDEVGMSAA